MKNMADPLGVKYLKTITWLIYTNEFKSIPLDLPIYKITSTLIHSLQAKKK